MKFLLVFFVAVMLLSTGKAFGQVHNHVILPMPPAEKAAYDAASQLVDAAFAALDAGKYAEAEADVKQSMSLYPLGLFQLRPIASALDALGKKGEAIKVYAQFADASAAQPIETLPYALLLVKSGQYTHALKIYENALPHVGSELTNGNELLSEDGDFTPEVPQPRALETDIRIAMGFVGEDDYRISGKDSRDKSVGEFREP
jgi:tetratricopeptide (TPR) repeat protein